MSGNKDMKKVVKIVSGIAVDSIDITMKDPKLTVTGAMDPVALVTKLRKTFNTEIISVGPVSEAQKKDDNKSSKNEQS